MRYILSQARSAGQGLLAPALPIKRAAKRRGGRGLDSCCRRHVCDRQDGSAQPSRRQPRGRIKHAYGLAPLTPARLGTRASQGRGREPNGGNACSSNGHRRVQGAARAARTRGGVGSGGHERRPFLGPARGASNSFLRLGEAPRPVCFCGAGWNREGQARQQDAGRLVSRRRQARSPPRRAQGRARAGALLCGMNVGACRLNA
ncbi:MAG: hypothetical protein J3K34DRAFT_410475 [Monoraphidium minutum]|nr:MAG: hypothetical protein J3K34DRAFT_410475 [Monoraphidium minutum]